MVLMQDQILGFIEIHKTLYIFFNFLFCRNLHSLQRNQSGYRCSEHNSSVSSTGANGPHTTGKALDIAVKNSQHRKQLIEYFAPKVTGLGIAKSFIHIDLLYEEDGFPGRPNSWVY